MKVLNIQQKNNYKISMCFLVMFVLFSFSMPQKADAQFVPNFDFALNATESVRLGIDTQLWSKEYIVDLVAYTAASVAIEQISVQLQNMILGAANSFVRDLTGELKDLENSVGEQLGIDINLAGTCFPGLDFSPEPMPAWNMPKFKASITCKFDDVIPGGNVQSFYNNYNQGGRKAFMKMAFYQNPYRRATAITSEQRARNEKAQKQELEQLSWGRGLRAARDSLTGLIKTPASAVQKQLDEAFSMSQQRMQNADELTEILVAVVSSVVSNAISENVEF